MWRGQVLNDSEFPRSAWFRNDTERGGLEGPNKELHFFPGNWAHIVPFLKLSLNDSIKFNNMLGNRWMIKGGKGLRYGLYTSVETKTETIWNAWVLIQQTSCQEVLVPCLWLVGRRGIKPFALEDSSERHETACHTLSTRDRSREWKRSNRSASASPNRGCFQLG